MKAATLPYDYAPPRQVNGIVRTCRLVEIGILHEHKPTITVTADAAQLQDALLAAPQRNGEPGRGLIARRALGLALAFGALVAALDIWVWHP